MAAVRRRRRDVAVFGLSFLDCISCGFGAAVLLFMLVDHARVDRDESANSELITRVDAIENQVLDGQQALLAMRAALSRDVTATQTADREAERLRQKIELLRAAAPEGPDAATTRDARMQKLQDELLALQTRVDAMRAASQDAAANATRTVAGEGQRQYLSGLSVDGRRVLILVDASASMLGESIVDAIRRRNMSAAARQAAPKWRRTLATVDWVTAQLPVDGQFQIVVFNEKARPVMGTANAWIASDGGRALDRAMTELRKVVPEGGTSLVNAMATIRSLSPAPDQVVLVTDGLPTQGASPRSGVATGKDRLRYFNEATSALPRSARITTILLPMEGDPKAAAAFWHLGRESGGGFMEPASDWP